MNKLETKGFMGLVNAILKFISNDAVLFYRKKKEITAKERIRLRKLRRKIYGK